MNSQTHRLVFNKFRGCLIAVGEHARSSAVAGCSGVRRSKRQSITALGSSFEGQSVNITAGKDQNIKGSNVLADQNVDLSAGGNVKIEAAQNTSSSSHFHQTTKSGLFSGGGLSVTLGKQMQSVDSQGKGKTAAGSTVGSTGGNVSITAGQTYTQTGSDVITPGLNSPSGSGNIDITAKTVDIKEARETGSQSTEQKFKQSGLTVAITSPVISALQTANNQLQAAGNTSSSRMQALAAANVAMNLKQGAGQVQDALAKGDATGGAGISISLGASSNQSQQQSSANSAKGSKVNAGGNVSITATGAGQGSDITVQGSNVQAGKATTLKADDQVNIVAAQNTTQENNSSSNKSGSIGVGMQLGARGGQAGVTVSASAGKGSGAGNSTAYTNSQVSGSTVNIESGGDTNIKGAVVKGEQVKANVGGNLNIASLQDSSQYKDKSQQLGGSVTFGPTPGGSLNVGQTKINSDYKSVNEQSAIRAGDGGFNVNVQGKTELIGGQITSTQAAIDNNKNSYEAKQGTTTTDLQNNANFKAKGVGVGIGAGAPTPGATLSSSMSGAGFGKDGGSAQSTTTAGISGVTGNAAARTGDKSTSIAPIFDKDKVQKEVAAQVAITSEFGKQASKAVGSYAKSKLDEATVKGDQAGVDAWKEGGSSRVALHAVVGGLTGGAAGAVGAGAASAAAPQIDQLQGQLKTALKDAGLGDSAANVISSLAGGTTAAAIGAAASGGSVAGGATAFNADMNNRQLHPSERQKAAELAKKSGGKYTQAQIEDAMRNAGNSDKGESIVAGMVVDPKVRDAIYDKGSVWTMGEDGKLVQVMPPQPSKDLTDFIKANTGATYNWYTPSAESAAAKNAPRDRLTNLPLDDKGRYSRTVVLDGKAFEPKYLPCATVECQSSAKNLDMSDPASQAYVKALDQQVFKDIGTGATLVTLVTPLGAAGATLSVVGVGSAVGESALSKDPLSTGFDKAIEDRSEKSTEWIIRNVLGHSPSVAARAAALINLTGGFEAFRERVKSDILGLKPDEKK